MQWLKDNDFSCHVIEAKATYNPKAGAYVSAPVIAGMPDVIGCTPDGSACFIELKAPGRLNTLKPHQRAFLLKKLEYGCFAVVVDSVELLSKLYSEWLQGADMFRHLPKEKARPFKEDDELGF